MLGAGKKCLCCGKLLLPECSEYERNVQWHRSCIKRFFGTFFLPDLNVTEEELNGIARAAAEKGFTVPGVQKKMSLHLDSSQDKPRLTLVNYPTGYILKPQTDKWKSLPEAEYMVMNMAEASGIAVVPHALMWTDGGTELAYITRRVDRIPPDSRNVHWGILAMEDFCQLDLRLTEDKYRSSCERCGKVIRRYSDQPGMDLSELFLRLVFSFVTGNSDMHLKNFSLIETAEGSQKYVLSPAYDLLPVQIILPDDMDETALTLNGKKRNIRRKDFLAFAAGVGIPASAAAKMIAKIVSLKSEYLRQCRESYMPEEYKNCFCDLVEKRAAVLTS